MRRDIAGLVFLGLMGCASGGYPVGRQPDVVIVGDDRRGRADDGDYDDDGEWRGNRGRKDKCDKVNRGNGRGRGNAGCSYGGYRVVTVERGYYPPRGLCRVWFEGRQARVQPRAMRCDQLYGRVPARSFVLYAGNAWDSDYDWYRYQRDGGRVPSVIVRIAQSMRR